MQINYKLYRNNNSENNGYGKYYARVAHEEMIDLDALSEHMSGHNSVFSKGNIKGLLTDMVACIKELVLDGKKVKLDDLAIFGVAIKSEGADSEAAFSAKENIKSLRLSVRATGNLSNKKLNASDFSLARADKTTTTSGSNSGNSGGTVVENP